MPKIYVCPAREPGKGKKKKDEEDKRRGLCLDYKYGTWT